jgi:transcription initiation factor TFIIE subunit alpha
MKKEFLLEVVSSVVGKQFEKIGELLDSKKHVNEFIIAKKLDITINQARNILYRLSEYGLVSSIRKKDKKKGWYTYFWRIENLKSLEFLKGMIVKKIENLDRQIDSRESKTYYFSEITGVEYTEEVALAHDFICPESGQLLQTRDNTKIIKDLKRAKDKFQQELNEVDLELEKEKGSLEKVREKEMKKEAEEKAKKKVEQRAARKAIRDASKPLKKEVKKTPKKTLKKAVEKIVKKATKKKKI